jgi:N6-L-threonylcarbamoyladenine synthase
MSVSFFFALAAAVVSSDKKILSEFVIRQNEVHAPLGGIVPKAAAQYHALNIDKTVSEAMKIAQVWCRILPPPRLHDCF